MIPSAHVSVWGRARRRRVGDRFEYERERGAEFQRGAHLTCEGGRGGGQGTEVLGGVRVGRGGGGRVGKGWRGSLGKGRRARRPAVAAAATAGVLCVPPTISMNWEKPASQPDIIGWLGGGPAKHAKAHCDGTFARALHAPQAAHQVRHVPRPVHEVSHRYRGSLPPPPLARPPRPGEPPPPHCLNSCCMCCRDG